MLAEMTAEMEALALAAIGSISDVAAGWITPQYLPAMMDLSNHIRPYKGLSGQKKIL